MKVCPKCKGKSVITCSRCSGSGQNPETPGSICHACQGKGVVQCPTCGGKGTVGRKNISDNRKR